MIPSSRSNTVKLHPRKGGGGKHKKGRKGSAAAKHGASDAFLDSPGSVSFPLSGNTASAYSDGGGNSFVLPSDNKFSGRTAGGCSRVSPNLKTEVYGLTKIVRPQFMEPARLGVVTPTGAPVRIWAIPRFPVCFG